MSYSASDPITTIAQVRDIVAGEFPSQTGKILDHIDALCRVWIERSPFLVMATVGTAGEVDVSPKGDPAGFVKVLDRKTLAIPDRPGNHRYDSFRNILDTRRVGLVFFVPNRNEVVRVNGSAQIVRDRGIREQMAINTRVPDFAVIVDVEEAFYHCGKSVIRSALWSPGKAAPVDGLPTYGEALIAHANLDTPLDEMHRILKNNDDNRLYDE